MHLAAVGCSLPPHYFGQHELLEALAKEWKGRFRNPRRLEQIHRNVLVGGRHLALPIEGYEKLDGFGAANSAFLTCALDLGESAVRDALDASGLEPRDVDHVFSVTVTGIATPSIDARLVNRLGLRSDVKRTPIFGLGCVAGAAGISRATDYLRAYPDQTAVLLSTELCSLTLQREDFSIANLIATGLFGDGAAAVVLRGAETGSCGPRVIATRSIFYPDTERVMGWDVSDGGFQVVLSAEVPKLAAGLRPDVDRFLRDQGLVLDDIGTFVCHPGGPRVLEAIQDSLSLPPGALARSWEHLAEVGNLSSASVLFLLAEVLEEPPAPGSFGLLLAMGPGFCSELVLLQW